MDVDHRMERERQPLAAPPSRASTAGEWRRALDEFGGQVAGLVEDDYGDWMRRANLYWHRLAEALSDTDRETQRRLSEIHRVIQYNPSFLVQKTRRKAIDLVLSLREHLGGRGDQEPRDFAASTEIQPLEGGAPSYSERFANPEPVHVGPAVADGSDRGFIGKG